MKHSVFRALRARPGQRRLPWAGMVALGVLMLVALGVWLGQAQATDSAPAVVGGPGATWAQSQPASPATSPASDTQPASNQLAGTQPDWWKGAGGAGGLTPKADDKLMWRMLASVVVIVALAVPLVWLSRRLGPRIGARAGKGMGLLETMYLGPRKTVHLVAVGSRRYLLGSSADQVSLLAEVTGAFAQPPREAQA